jgi:hypothetical protein
VARGLEVQVGVVDPVFAAMVAKACDRLASVRPKGSSIRAWAIARRSIVGSRVIIGGPRRQGRQRARL